MDARSLRYALADMLEFSKYSFNKAHAAAYAILAYITAKQKAY